MSASGLTEHSIKIVFSDDDLLVVEKPAGVLSVADGYDPTLPHLSNLLFPNWGKIWMVHRLDRETSGLMVTARNPTAHRALNQQFRDHQVTKVYHAVVSPIPDWDKTIIDAPLRVDADREHRTRVDALRGKPAQTDFRVLKRSVAYALIECRIRTGFRHQIRAHLYSLGLGIVGDKLYQPLQSANLASDVRMLLHAARLGFIHPTTGESLNFEAPDPIEFAAFI